MSISLGSRHNESAWGDAPPLGYKDEKFLESEDARPLRILAEYLQPLCNFRREGIHNTIVFFGSARLAPDGPLGRYYEEARETHGRAGTEEKVVVLGNIPRRAIEYRSTTLPELAVYAVIARKPEVAIVAELAHTNVPGSMHEKHYQKPFWRRWLRKDVTERLLAGAKDLDIEIVGDEALEEGKP